MFAPTIDAFGSSLTLPKSPRWSLICETISSP